MMLPYDADEPMTAGELRNKLRGVSNDTPIFIVLDKGDDNYDENGDLIQAHPLSRVEREWLTSDDGLGFSDSMSIILHLSDGFYENMP